MNNRLPNQLIHEVSPYLLQHAYNPVDWHPWSDDIFTLAARENKPLLISIGYAACHWCHVMEKETFTQTEAALLMNSSFINIKVDREERPDIDQVYMVAVQMMRGQGGWPLNVFALPDGRPFFGGTYFPNSQWKDLLQQITAIWRSRPGELIRTAEEVSEGIATAFQPLNKTTNSPAQSSINEAVTRWKNNFDMAEGGMMKAPKFPMPSHHLFLLRYQQIFGDKDILDFIKLSLTKMASGGIYDHLGGGFARYSTDANWKVPHFEKMLYDNAQMLWLYSEAWQLTRTNKYKYVAYSTISFILNELSSDEGGFYSSLDADSEGEEGKYYVWTEREIDEALGEDAAFFKQYYEVGNKGYWEDDKNILLTNSFTEGQDPQAEDNIKLSACRHKLLTIRQKRPRPSLDDKIMTSWNAMTSAALIEAYKVFGEEEFLLAAARNLDLLLAGLRAPGRLYHRYKNGKAGIPAFLEDYAWLIHALTSFPLRMDDSYIRQAKLLVEEVIEKFYDPASGLFFFTSSEENVIISRKTEVEDNVIPSSNAVLARAIHHLGLLFSDSNLLEISSGMLAAMTVRLGEHLPYYSYWGISYLEHTQPFYTLVICGEKTEEIVRELSQSYLPGLLIEGSIQASNLPLFKDRFVEGKTLLYLCTATECLLPVETVPDVLRLIERKGYSSETSFNISL